MDTLKQIAAQLRRVRRPKALPGWIAVLVAIWKALSNVDSVLSVTERLVTPEVRAFIVEWWWFALLIAGVGWLWWVSREGASLAIDRVGLVEEGSVPMDGVPIVVTVTVKNTGRPTTLDQWRIFVSPPNAGETELVGWVPDNDWQIDSDILYREDYLSHKTFSDPVPKGGRVRGFLTGNVINVRKDSLQHPKTIYRVEAVDAYGTHHEATVEWGSFLHPSKVMPTRTPGMRSPDRRPSTPSASDT